jgi:hypothetical protein
LHILHSRGTIMSPTGTLLIVKTAGEYWFRSHQITSKPPSSILAPLYR